MRATFIHLIVPSVVALIAENAGVMAATRVCSTAAYWVAAIVAIIFAFCPKFGALGSSTPGGVPGGITVVLYGMIVVVVFYHLLHVLAPAHLKDARPMGGEGRSRRSSQRMSDRPV